MTIKDKIINIMEYQQQNIRNQIISKWFKFLIQTNELKWQRELMHINH